MHRPYLCTKVSAWSLDEGKEIADWRSGHRLFVKELSQGQEIVSIRGSGIKELIHDLFHHNKAYASASNEDFLEIHFLCLPSRGIEISSPVKDLYF